jgi:hypothetical protein
MQTESIPAIIRRDVYEGTFPQLPEVKSLNIHVQINPLEAGAAFKNKSKDIHLPSIDVNFASNRILFVPSFLPTLTHLAC